MYNTPINVTCIEEAIQLLEKWRDWHWREHLHYRYHTEDNRSEALYNVSATVYNDAISLIREEHTLPENSCTFFNDLKYGEYPDER